MLFRKRLLFTLLYSLIFCLTGCWNNKDITELNIVVGVGIDQAPNNQIELTVQIVKPATIKARQQGGMDQVTQTLTARGRTIFEANRNLLTFSSRRLYYGHIQLIMISEGLARKGISDILDFFARDHEPDLRTEIIITKGITASQSLKLNSSLEDIPVTDLRETLRNTNGLPKIIDIQLVDLLKNIASTGTNSVVAKLEIAKNKENITTQDLNITGAAVFKKDKLCGWLSPTEARSYIFVQNKFKNGIIVIPNPIDKKKPVAIEMTHSHTKKSIQFVNGRPKLIVEVKNEGNIGEQEGKGDLTSPSIVRKLEQETSLLITKEINHLITKTQQELKCDIFGFGNLLHQQYPSYWENVEGNWNEFYSALEFEVKVNQEIRRSGWIREITKPK
ncbi:Ger(x)C family spore germination protein [Bacillota bacterium LX-D]|nr:Ger(x)C family spore germination protein [Bacillota bacterium LX-D]